MSVGPDVSRGGALAPESAVQLEVSGRVAVTWHCTPADLEVLAAGWLVAEGIAAEPDDIVELRVEGAAPERAVVEARLTAAARDRLWRAIEDKGCSGGWPAGSPPTASGRSPGPRRPDERTRLLLEDRDHIAGLFRNMFEAATLRSTVGGVHTGGLVRGRSLVAVVEDVSRHHVVDRLVGTALKNDTGLAGAVFLLSSRISGTMACKACRAGVGALVSRSIPTDLAASVAARCGLVLVGRARGEDRYVHWPA